jgi:pimeloyl-ACP methyl ester carboxylesterase
MPTLTTDDGISLYYEEAGAGTPVVFVHEFAGDLRSWEPQMRHFSRRYRCIAYNARGYPPSGVPPSFERYSQERARDDILSVLDGLGIERAHIVGLSMGAFATLHFGMVHGGRAISLVTAGIGHGAHPSQYEQFQRDSLALADTILQSGMVHVAGSYGHSNYRTQLRDKDPRGFAEFIRNLSRHDATGSANTLRGYMARRPSLYDLRSGLARISAPLLIVAGDEDEPTLEPSLMLKRTISTSALVVLPKSGHMMNLEEPALFNRVVEDFFHQVETGRWTSRTPPTGADRT